MKKKTYKYISVLIALLLALAMLAGCGNSGNTDGTGGGSGGGGTGGSGDGAAVTALTGTTEEILTKIIDDATAALNDEYAIPATFTDPVTAENSPGMLGVLSDDFVSYVEEATVATAAIATFAFQVAVVKCKSDADAQTISTMIETGYDSGKWICVFPEKSQTMTSGPYVLLVAGRVDQADAITQAFVDEAGGVVRGPNLFYEGELGGGEIGIDGGGGMAIDVGPAPLD